MAVPNTGIEQCWQSVKRTGASIEVLTRISWGIAKPSVESSSLVPMCLTTTRKQCRDFIIEFAANAEYQRTLNLLKQVREEAPAMPTKSGLMLGLGETREELLDVLADLRASTAT